MSDPFMVNYLFALLEPSACALVKVSRLAALGFLAAVTFAPLPPRAQEIDIFPVSLDASDLFNWLRAQTHVSPSDVFAVGASSVVALMSTRPVAPDSPGRFRTVIHAEVTDPKTAAEEGYLSWMAEIEVDCPSRRTMTIRLANYTQRDLGGVSHEAAVPRDWIAPSGGSRLYRLIGAVCDPGFQRPFAAASISPLATAAFEPEAPIALPPTSMAPRSAPTALPGETELQITAAASWLQAREALESARQRFRGQMAGLEPLVVRTTIDGAVVYRALFSGFQTPAQAQALCATMKAQGHACFVRQQAGA